MKAIILAAGKGTRLSPLTDLRPKHLLEVGGKAILKWQIDELLENNEIEEIIIVVNYYSEQIKNAVISWTDDKRIRFAIQKETLGTGDAVNTALNLFQFPEKFLVLNGDVLLQGSITKILSKNYDNAILGAKVLNPSLFGVLKEENGYLVNIDEKPDVTNPDSLINAGLYIFPPSAVELFKDLKLSKRGEKELTDVLAHLINKKEKIKIVSHEGKWFDIGHPWQLMEANEYYLDKFKGSFSQTGKIESSVHIKGDIHVSKSARIRSGVYIEGTVYLDEGADIGPNCYIRGHTYIGKNVRVGNGCEIKNSIIYESTHAAHLSYVGDSILGRFSNLGAGTITANLRHDGKPIKVAINEIRINSGRRKLGVIMGDNVKTGIGVNILPGIKIASGSWINAGVLVSRDILP